MGKALAGEHDAAAAAVRGRFTHSGDSKVAVRSGRERRKIYFNIIIKNILI